MKTVLSFNLKMISVTALTALALVSTGCGKPEKGDPGRDGAGRIVSSINCVGTIAGSTPTFNGIKVEYDAVLTSSGDVYATGNIIDIDFQYSGTSFYAADQNGADTAQVLVTADVDSTPNGGYWSVTLDRSSLIATARYYSDDRGTGSMTRFDFAPSTCKRNNW